MATVSHTQAPELTYQLAMSHKEYCKLQSMLILAFNTAKANEEDKKFMHALETTMLNYRNKIGT